jgi:di/tricarboxylate transporter
MMAMSFFGPFNEHWADLAEMTYFRARCTAVLLLAFLLFMGLWPAPFIDPHTGERAHAAGRLMTEGLNIDYTLFLPEFLLVGLVVLVVAIDLRTAGAQALAVVRRRRRAARDRRDPLA